jgi:possible membrane protein
MKNIFCKFLENNFIKETLLTVSRVLLGFSFALHGTAKLFEYPMSMTSGNGSVELMSLMGIGGLIEVIFGGLFILGLFTRLSAFILAGQMAVAYFMFHAFSNGSENVFLPLLNGGEIAWIYAMAFIAFIYVKVSKFSLDYLVFKNSK